MTIRKFVPILQWLPDYSKEDLKGDLPAGLTVGVMLIPQGMAYAMLAGLPPVYGLYAATLPLLLYAIFGTSRQLAVGPVAMVSLLVATGVGALADPGSTAFVQYAILLAFMVGLIQFLMGVFRLGFLVNFLSHPVISGFTSAAALIIGLSQLKHLLGFDIPRSHLIHEIIGNAIAHISEVHPATLILGLGGMLVIMGIRKFNKTIPGSLVAVIAGILIVAVFSLDDKGLKIVQDIPVGFPKLSTSLFEINDIQALLPVALTIALIGFVESIAVAKAMQARHKGYEVDSNQELIGLGLANIGGSFFQSFPVTGGFSRTAVNDQAGARTGMASVISALLIILTLLFLTPLFYYLPKAILASVILVAVFGLIDVKEAGYLWKTDRRDFVMLLATFIATLTLGIEQGIAIGILLSLAFVVYKSTYPHIAQLGRLPGTNEYRNIVRFQEATESEDILIIRFDAQMFFANTAYFKEKLQKMEAAKGEKLKAVILVGTAINSLDSSAVHTLEDIVEDYKARNIAFMVTGVKGPVRDIMCRCGLMERIGEQNFYMRIHEAVDAFDKMNSSENQSDAVRQKIATQTNIIQPDIR
ncbi:MAG: solute carrier family 26 protein [Bacteroidetes bacterium]|nr:solute carrier family 26 protein [Bacteroidota bacterium]